MLHSVFVGIPIKHLITPHRYTSLLFLTSFFIRHIFDKNGTLRHFAGMVRESFGYTVFSAKDVEDAIAKFMENRDRISLALLDMIMPKKNGKEVSEAIRKVSLGIKTLFVSGYTMNLIKTKEWTEAGFNFIRKPILPKDLLIKLRETLSK